MTEIVLHVYDITRDTDKSSASAVLGHINSAGRWLSAGGVYHGGIQVLSLAHELPRNAEARSGFLQCAWESGVWR